MPHPGKRDYEIYQINPSPPLPRPYVYIYQTPTLLNPLTYPQKPGEQPPSLLPQTPLDY